ncbi:MAG: NosD domain-containing protein, partial [Propionicimonas sp.]|nr:NosD domain-containing protein [Propionicimonas sp.]
MPVNTTLRRTLSGAISLALIGAAGLVATPAFAVGPTTFPAEFTVDDTAKTITLTSDFEATETIVIPDGYTFDGAGNTVYATGATWQGPVVANDGAGDIAVTDLAIIRTVVDARWDNDSTYGNQTVAGITVKNGALTASDVHIEGIRGTTLNQNGYGILVLNTTLTTPATVLVDGADISTYTKGGVYVFGQTTTATIRNSTIGGGILGAATNPIMISAGAESTIQDNVIAGGQWKDSTAQSTGILFYGAGDSTVKGNAISGADVAIAIDPGETTDGRYEGGKISSQVALAGNSLTAPSSIPSGGNVPVGIRVVTGKTGTVKHFANTFSSYQAANELVSESADGLTVAPLYVAPTVGLTRIPSAQDWGSVRVTISGNTADSRVPASYAVTLFKDGKAVTTKSSLAISTTTVDFPLSSAGSYTAEVKLTAMGGQVAKTSTAVVVAAATFTTTPKPVITGSAKVGAKLTASAGTWVPSATLAYQWSRDSSTISGATGSTYTLTGADYGKAITVKVTGTRTGYTTVSQTSAATAKVAAATMTAAKPAISGTAKVGKTLTAKPGTWKPSGVTFSYQWYR